MVLIVDENQPRNCWLKGVVIDRVVAKDGQVRRATVRTANGVLHRLASKLAVFDVGRSFVGKNGDETSLTDGGLLPTIDDQRRE